MKRFFVGVVGAGLVVAAVGCSPVGERMGGTPGIDGDGGGGGNGGAGGFEQPEKNEPEYVRRARAKIHVDGYPGSIVVRDFDEDGKDDVAVIACDVPIESGIDWTNCRMSVLVGKGKYEFSEAVKLPLGYLRSYQGLEAGDFDGDGKLDLVSVVGPQALGIAFWHGLGNGTFEAPTETTINCPSIGVDDAPRLRLFPGHFGKTKADGIFFRCDGAQHIWNEKDGSFYTTKIADIPHINERSFRDFNGDGITDYITTSGTPSGCTTDLFRGTGDYAFISEGQSQPMGLNPCETHSPIIVMDVNGDKREDLVGRFESFLRNEDETFSQGPPFLHPFFLTVYDSLLRVGDLNRDGNADILDTGAWKGITILLGDGSGRFDSRAKVNGISVANVGVFGNDDQVDIVLGVLWDLVIIPGPSLVSIAKQ